MQDSLSEMICKLKKQNVTNIRILKGYNSFNFEIPALMFNIQLLLERKVEK